MPTSTDQAVSLQGVLNELQGGMPSSNVVVGSIDLADVEKALSSDDTITIQIVGRIRLSPAKGSLIDAATAATSLDDKNGVAGIPLAGLLEIITCELGTISHLKKERGGSFSFEGTHSSSYWWEANYNAGWHREDTSTLYRVTVNVRTATTTYEVIDVAHRSR